MCLLPSQIPHAEIAQWIAMFTSKLRQPPPSGETDNATSDTTSSNNNSPRPSTSGPCYQQSPEEWLNTMEGVEKYAMLKLHPLVFGGATTSTTPDSANSAPSATTTTTTTTNTDAAAAATTTTTNPAYIQNSDVSTDLRLLRKSRLLRTFITLEHLDIDAVSAEGEEVPATAWANAAKALHQMNQFRAPRDKLICLLNCCRVRAFCGCVSAPVS